MVWHVHWVQPLGELALWLAGGRQTRDHGAIFHGSSSQQPRPLITSWGSWWRVGPCFESTHGRCLCIQTFVVSTPIASSLIPMPYSTSKRLMIQISSVLEEPIWSSRAFKCYHLLTLGEVSLMKSSCTESRYSRYTQSTTSCIVLVFLVGDLLENELQVDYETQKATPLKRQGRLKYCSIMCV